MSTRDAGRQTIVYTPGYAAPEQFLGRAEPRSDLFSLAATLYHLATGREPRGHETSEEIAVLLDDPSRPIPEKDRWFYDLLRINLSADPEERYYSAQALKADLERRSVTTEVDCPRCGTVNEVRLPYCACCAEPLTPSGSPCRHCGEANRLGSRFCIHCGKRPG
jgi:serine/threonine protein kinase